MSITVSEYCHPLFIVMGVDDTPKIIMNYLGMAKVTISSFHIHYQDKVKALQISICVVIAGYLAYYFHWASFMYENLSSCTTIWTETLSFERLFFFGSNTIICRYISTSIIILPFQYQVYSSIPSSNQAISVYSLYIYIIPIKNIILCP